MTNKANKGFVFSAYDKFFRFLLMDNRLFLSIYIGILSFKGYFEKYLESIYFAIRYISSTEFAILLFISIIHILSFPARDRNSYLVLYLNFSGIIGELHNYRAGLDAHCQTCFDYFCDIYAEYLPQGIKEQLDAKNGAVEQLDYLYHECERAGQDIYLFIDEYDHFINAILSDAESLHRYTKETHKEGCLRAFFNKIKSGTYSSIKRCFITGVSPVTMDVVVSRGIL